MLCFGNCLKTMKDNKFLESNHQIRLQIQYIKKNECSLFRPKVFLLLLFIAVKH